MITLKIEELSIKLKRINSKKKNDPILKKIEFKVKHFVNKRLFNKKDPIIINEITDVFELKPNCRILLLRQDRIGDLLVSVPFIKYLRNKYLECEIDIILSEKNINAKRAVEPYISNIYLYEKKILKIIKLIIDLKKRKYDLLIDLYDNSSTTSTFLIKFIKAKYNLGLEKSNNLIYSHIVPLLDKNKYHIVERIANLSIPFGFLLQKNDLLLEFNIFESEKKQAEEKLKIEKNKKYLGINLSGSTEAKYWGTENYIGLIKKINIENPEIEIIIFATEKFENELNIIVSDTKSKATPRTNSFLEFAANISLCDFLISVDTSVVHLAAAFQIPIISLHIWTGTIDTGLPWYSFNNQNKYLVTKNNLSDIKVIDVFNAYLELI